MKQCTGCGALVPDVEGPTHAYLGATAGCWSLYGEVLAREYSDLQYGRVHHLTVDVYAAQHPGSRSTQTIKSVAVHLISLSLSLDQNLARRESARIKQKAAASLKDHFKWLTPPSEMGVSTVVDVYNARDPAEHAAKVRQWSRDVWEAWLEHHTVIRHWIGLI